MEEKHLDHGTDSPRFIIKFLFLFLFSTNSWATTFGPIPLVDQAKHSGDIYHGIIHGRRVEIEPYSKKPYTYWGLSVIEQLQGNTTAREITLRQPGGEMGEIGYRVASSADFSENEEVIVLTKNTPEGDTIKEVVGLASGKYSLESNAKGEKILRSGIGFYVKDTENNYISLAKYKALLTRTQNNQNTESDRKILLAANQEAMEAHLHFPNESAPMQNKNTPEFSNNSQNKKSDNIIQNPPNATDTSHEGTTGANNWWLILVAIGIGIGFFIARKK